MSGPAIYLEDPADVFDYATDAKEAIDNTQPGGGGHSSRGSQEETLVYFIPFNKVASAKKYFLGFSYADDGAPYALHRALPARHPRNPTLYAYTFSDVGFVPEPDPENPNGEVYVLSPFEETDGSEMYYAGYQYSVCTIRFKSFGRMKFLPDEDIDSYLDEYKRNTVFGNEPQIQSLSADGSSQLTFREGAGVTGKAYPAPIAILMAKSQFSMVWSDVAHDYLSSDPDILLLDQILPILGTVNQDFFLGFFPGTLLLTAVRAENLLFPVIPVDLFNPITGWTLTFQWELFDPEKGVSYYIPGTKTVNSPYRGHRVFPWRSSGTGAGSGFWFYANRDDGTELLPLTNHWDIFKHQADPS